MEVLSSQAYNLNPAPIPPVEFAEGSADQPTVPHANSITLPFFLRVEPVPEASDDPSAIEPAIPAESLDDYAAEIFLSPTANLSAFDPNHDEPVPDRAPQLLQRILSNPLASVPEHAGRTIQEQAYAAFVHNYPLIVSDISGQFATDTTFSYARATDAADTFLSSYEAHKSLA